MQEIIRERVFLRKEINQKLGGLSMSIMFLTTPVIMAYAGLEETDCMIAALISGTSWFPATGCCYIAKCNAVNRVNIRSTNSFGRSQRKPGVLKLAI